MNPSRPLELVCFFPIEIPTKQGDSWAFTAVDVFSKFLFFTGVENNNNDTTILKHIQLLLDNQHFQMHRHNGFNLVFHKQTPLIEQIKKIIAPLNGKVLINEALLTKEMIPVIEYMFSKLPQ